MNHGLCIVDGCINKGRYCRLHPSGQLKPKDDIKKFSKKREKVNRKQYSPLVTEILKEHPFCRVQSPVCTKMAEGLHHLKGRHGDLLTERKYLIPCCNLCNQFIEKNDAWARSHGWKMSKFSEPSKNQTTNNVRNTSHSKEPV